MGDLDDWKYCPVCATPITPHEGSVECPTCGFVTYAHSKPTASAVVSEDSGRVLLSKRAFDPEAGKWDLPGGFVHEGEHPLACVRRELLEEAGIDLADEELLGIWMDRYEYKRRTVATLNVYYAASVGGGEIKAADDVLEFRWFAPHEVPPEELAFGHIADVLSTWRTRQQHA